MAGRRVGTGRRIAAVLAGGLVLGIGAATTLAAWTDSQHATATFTAGVFALESSVDGVKWRSHTADEPAVLAVSSAGMTPGASGVGFLDVRTTKASSVGGTVVLGAAAKDADSDDAIVAFLESRVKVIPVGTTCTPAVMDSTAFRAVTASPGVADQGLPPGGTETARYCFEVRLAPDAPGTVQGLKANLVWTFTGTNS